MMHLYPLVPVNADMANRGRGKRRNGPADEAVTGEKLC